MPLCIVLQKPPLLRMLGIEVELGRLDEMRAQDLLQPLGFHVLAEDIHVARPVSAEAGPSADDWMRVLVDAIGWVERLALRPANEHLAPKALEDRLVGEEKIHPVVGCPAFVALGEGQPLALLRFTELLLMA